HRAVAVVRHAVLSLLQRTPPAPLLPYTTLFRSVGDAQAFGGGDYAMRLWLDPDKVASRGLTASDVLRAVREQNIQVSAGQLGARSEEHTSELQSREKLVCRLLLEKKNT